MSLVDDLGRLKDIRQAEGFETLENTANYCLMHYTKYDVEFIRFCERYLEQIEESQ